MFIPIDDRSADPREVLKECPVGSMLLFMGKQTFASPIEVVFGIREESLRIPFVKTSPIVIRPGVLE